MTLELEKELSFLIIFIFMFITHIQYLEELKSNLIVQQQMKDNN